MKYHLKIDEKIKKKVENFPEKDKERIKKSIDLLSENPRPNGYKKLKGEKRGMYRIRSGNYRVIYSIEDRILLILIVDIDHRKDVYCE